MFCRNNKAVPQTENMYLQIESFTAQLWNYFTKFNLHLQYFKLILLPSLVAPDDLWLGGVDWGLDRGLVISHPYFHSWSPNATTAKKNIGGRWSVLGQVKCNAVTSYTTHIAMKLECAWMQIEEGWEFESSLCSWI